MSNYPPGVTGFEPQIAGYPEGEAPHTCDSSECEHHDDAWPFYEDNGVRQYDDCESCGVPQMEVWPEDEAEAYWPEDFDQDR